MARTAKPVDIPGLNYLDVERVLRATAMTCNRFRASDHGNARPHTTGESVRCLNCDDPQWKHWLRSAVLSLEDLRSRVHAEGEG